MLALRGSGQALYVGLAEDCFVVASEPYGLVEETSRYLRLDGETPADPDRAAATRGQIVVLARHRRRHRAGDRALRLRRHTRAVSADELQHAQITTRDVDRGEYPHFLLKEISEAADSFRKTLRGKVLERDGRLGVSLGDETLTPSLRQGIRDGTIGRVVVIGQGTAAVAGQSLAAALDGLAGGRLDVEATPATELSGFGLRDGMQDTLVIAISQSGTTTDTNRTVDLARDHGATVVAIVNRRNSDLVDKSDGVLYTSDGRDVEMSVASTKAFYAQIAAGWLLAIALATEAGVVDDGATHELLTALRDLPDAMRSVVGRRAEIAEIAQRHALHRRYWAVVGNGANSIAAREIRIKLSELCYKAIACDVTEDKKHIDLSSEPLVVVCAAGLTGSNADDVGKEVAIYRAHRAAPIVIAEDPSRFPPRSTPSRYPRCTRASTSCSRPSPAICSGTRPPSPSTPRRGRCARSEPGSKRRRRPRRVRTRCSNGSPPRSTSLRVASSTACAPASTTGRSRPAPQRGSRHSCGTRRARCCSTRTRSSTARSARRARSSRT